MPNQEGKKFVMPMPRIPKSTTNCGDVADCIDNSGVVQDALTDFIENNDFNTNGNWSFDGDVEFNAQVDFNNGPVNFNDLQINMVNVDVFMDAGSTFTNNGTTNLNNLVVNTITLGAAPDLTNLISADVGNIITTGTD